MSSECGENAFRGARLAFHMLLASLRFRHHRLTACASPPTPEVEGSDPPIFGSGSGAGTAACVHAPSLPLPRVVPIPESIPAEGIRDHDGAVWKVQRRQ